MPRGKTIEEDEDLHWIPTFPGNNLLWELEREESQEIIQKVIELIEEDNINEDLENAEIDADADYWRQKAEKNFQELLRKNKESTKRKVKKQKKK